MLFVESEEFQFLIGRLKTLEDKIRELKRETCFNSLQVGSKRPLSIVMLTFLMRFQFLIGRLKTAILFFGGRGYLNCFNSLQVGSKLYPICFLTTAYVSFNSLQVGSKPCSDTWYAGCGASVSIPYRQAQNVGRRTLNMILMWLFQFLIGRLKTRFYFKRPGFFPTFQFLIGRLKTL